MSDRDDALFSANFELEHAGAGPASTSDALTGPYPYPVRGFAPRSINLHPILTYLFNRPDQLAF